MMEIVHFYDYIPLYQIFFLLDSDCVSSSFPKWMLYDQITSVMSQLILLKHYNIWAGWMWVCLSQQHLLPFCNIDLAAGGWVPNAAVSWEMLSHGKQHWFNSASQRDTACYCAPSWGTVFIKSIKQQKSPPSALKAFSCIKLQQTGSSCHYKPLNADTSSSQRKRSMNNWSVIAQRQLTAEKHKRFRSKRISTKSWGCL